MFPVPQVPVPFIDSKVFLKLFFEQLWNSRWKDIQETNKLRSLTGSPGSSYWSMFSSRRDQVAYSRLRIGHTKLTHRYLLEKSSPPECQTCKTNLTVRRILLDCREFSDRRSLFHIDSTLPKILNPSNVDRLLGFVRSIDLYNKI